MTLKKVGKEQYDAELDGYDYHIRRDSHFVNVQIWTVDAFRSAEENNDKAHCGSEELNSLDEALSFIIEDGFRK